VCANPKIGLTGTLGHSSSLVFTQTRSKKTPKNPPPGLPADKKNVCVCPLVSVRPPLPPLLLPPPLLPLPPLPLHLLLLLLLLLLPPPPLLLQLPPPLPPLATPDKMCSKMTVIFGMK